MYVCVCGSRKAEQLSPESRLSHKLNARLTAVNGTSEKLLLFGCSTLHSTQHPLYPSLCCSLWQPLTHSTTQHLLSSGSSECFGPRVRKSISFMFFCWNFMGDRSSFSFFFLKRVRERETGVGGREVGQMDRAARKNFFWQRCSFLWWRKEWGNETWLSWGIWAAFLSTKINLIFSLGDGIAYNENPVCGFIRRSCRQAL